MKKFFTIFFLVIAVATSGQGWNRLTETIKEFHQAMVKKNTAFIAQRTDKALSYGHSNGWVETRDEMLTHIQTGYIVYNSIKEDSLNVVINGKTAHARFVGDYNVTLNGNTNIFHLRVLEVWIKKGKEWILFARQAVR